MVQSLDDELLGPQKQHTYVKCHILTGTVEINQGVILSTPTLRHRDLHYSSTFNLSVHILVQFKKTRGLIFLVDRTFMTMESCLYIKQT